jgi:hypothetical protein
VLSRARAADWARTNPLLVGAIVTGLCARILYWAVADRRLDDALITIKHAKNVADGVGLTHHLGEGDPVHGFTSALSVLIPLPGELIAEGGGLLAIRLVSLAAFVLAVVYAYRICRELELGPWPTGLALAYLALDQNQVFYGTAGMETQIAVAVLLAGIYCVLVEDFTKSGIWLGLALLARPDFVLWAAPAFVFLLIRSRDGAARTWLIGAAIVAPWLIFTILYYGSPVPNTIIAKSQAFGPDFPALSDPSGWFDFGWDLLKVHKGDWSTLAPFLERSFVLHTPLPTLLLKLIAWTVAGLAIVGAFSTWGRPSWRPAIIFVGLWIAYKVVFLSTGYFEWYGVPVIAVIFLLAAAGLNKLTEARPRLVVAVPAVVLALAYAIHIPFTLPLEARIQHQIEDRVRDQAGRYLGEVAKVGETIATEPSGYVGYYTNATLYDFPGLTSTTVTEALQDSPTFLASGGTTMIRIVPTLDPDWLVYRPYEWELLQSLAPEVAARYAPVREFSVSEEQSSLDRWGLSMLNIDRDFIVLRRTEGN